MHYFSITAVQEDPRWEKKLGQSYSPKPLYRGAARGYPYKVRSNPTCRGLRVKNDLCLYPPRGDITMRNRGVTNLYRGDRNTLRSTSPLFWEEAHPRKNGSSVIWNTEPVRILFDESLDKFLDRCGIPVENRGSGKLSLNFGGNFSKFEI